MATYSQVDDNLWRSARPDPNDYEEIKVKFLTVISLEGLEEDHKEALELAPVTVLSFPISLWQINFSGISQTYLARILKSIADAPKPVLVHCQHGQDRTGLVIAAYRVTQGWAKGKAWAEAKHYGYHGWPLNGGLSRTWTQFQKLA